MAAKHTTITVLLRTSQTLANGEHAVRLCVTKNRVRKYISLGFTCHLKEWDLKRSLPKSSHPLKARYDSMIAKAIREYKEKLTDFEVDGKDYTPAVLIDKVNTTVIKTTVLTYFESKIQNLRESNRIGNADVYLNTYNQLRTYLKKKDITFSQIDLIFLQSFETFFRKRSADLGGKGIHDEKPPVGAFIDSIFRKLKEGKIELTFDTTTPIVAANDTAIGDIFNKLNPLFA